MLTMWAGSTAFINPPIYHASTVAVPSSPNIATDYFNSVKATDNAVFVLHMVDGTIFRDLNDVPKHYAARRGVGWGTNSKLILKPDANATVTIVGYGGDGGIGEVRRLGSGLFYFGGGGGGGGGSRFEGGDGGDGHTATDGADGGSTPGFPHDGGAGGLGATNPSWIGTSPIAKTAGSDGGAALKLDSNNVWLDLAPGSTLNIWGGGGGGGGGAVSFGALNIPFPGKDGGNAANDGVAGSFFAAAPGSAGPTYVDVAGSVVTIYGVGTLNTTGPV